MYILGYCQIDYFENASGTPDPFFLTAGPAALVVSETMRLFIEMLIGYITKKSFF